MLNNFVEREGTSTTGQKKPAISLPGQEEIFSPFPFSKDFEIPATSPAVSISSFSLDFFIR